MPHSPSDLENLGYTWVKSNNGSHAMVRQLSHLERMFAIFNQHMYGSNCPFLGANISLQRRDHSLESEPLNILQLQTRAIQAFCQTRWKYPTVAARIVDGDKASYGVESRERVEKWAERTVVTVCQEGGWLALRERLSRESPLPTPDGDCCLFYLIVRPDESVQPELGEFDILMHTHHSLTDGSGIRVILNEFLQRLADPLPNSAIIWGEETRRLLPASVLLGKIEETESGIATVMSLAPGERSETLNKVDHQQYIILYSVIWLTHDSSSKPMVGLPVYRPNILSLMPEHRGTLLISHTFEDPNFLPRLLAIGRKQGVKLTGILQAAMLKAVYESSDIKPDPEDVYHSGSPMDLRNGHLMSEYCDRTIYVNSAVAIQMMHVPCNLFQTEQGNEDGLWKAAACISNQWETIRKKKGLAKEVDSDAKILIEAVANR